MALGNKIDNISQRFIKLFIKRFIKRFNKKPAKINIGTIKINVTDEKLAIETISTNLYKVNTAGFVEIISSDMPVIVDCYTEWCGPCKMINPIFAKLAIEYDGRVKFIKVDLDANPTIAKHFNVMGVPTLMLIKDKMKIRSIVGFSGEGKIRRAIDKMVEMEIDQFDS